MNEAPHYQTELAKVILEHKPLIVVETGLYKGVGARIILEALDQVGKGYLFSIDPLDTAHVTNGVVPKPELYTSNPINHPRFTWIRKKSCDALDELAAAVKWFDFFIHDSDHAEECQSYEYEAAWKYVRNGGVIASDDVYWGEPPHRAWDKFLSRHNIQDVHIAGNAQWFVKP